MDFNLIKMDETIITEEKFLTTYNKYPPNGWIRFAFKYFSKESEKKDLILKNSFIFFLFGLFCVGFFATIFDTLRNYILISTIIYSTLLVGLILYLSSAVILNNIRIKKIYSELGISRDEYNNLSKMYLN